MIETPAYDDATAFAMESAGAFEKVKLAKFILLIHILRIRWYMSRNLSSFFRWMIEDMPEQEEDNILMNYEPNQEEALNIIIPKYVTSLLYGAW